jgi:hypothetical protein
MRKVVIAVLAVFVLAFAVGLVTSDQAQAAPTKCSYQCGCNGEVLYCCRTGPIVSCKIVLNGPIECTQSADC